MTESSITPNPALYVAGRTWEPDFLVTFRGRVGIIEVDGASHAGRAASDKSRDRIFEDAGVAYVERLYAEDITDEDTAYEYVARFLRKLAQA